MVRVVGIDALVTFHPRSPPPANDGNQRLAATRDPRHPIPSRVRCLASLGAFSLLLSADPVLLHDVRTLLDDAGEIALVYLKLESVCLE